MSRVCTICRAPSLVVWCRACRSSYDRAVANDDGTLLAVIQWAARRTLRFARQSARQAAEGQRERILQLEQFAAEVHGLVGRGRSCGATLSCAVDGVRSLREALGDAEDGLALVATAAGLPATADAKEIAERVRGLTGGRA